MGVASPNGRGVSRWAWRLWMDVAVSYWGGREGWAGSTMWHKFFYRLDLVADFIKWVATRKLGDTSFST